MLPVPTVSYLAQFTGRDEGSFTAFADQALIQATLLFSIVTRREEYPADEDQEALAINAVLEMADRIYITRAKDGQPTGLFWWDLAVDELSLASSSLMSHASVYAFEDAVSAGTDGDRFILTPGDVADVTWLGVDDNVELRPRPRLG